MSTATTPPTPPPPPPKIAAAAAPFKGTAPVAAAPGKGTAPVAAAPVKGTAAKAGSGDFMAELKAKQAKQAKLAPKIDDTDAASTPLAAPPDTSIAAPAKAAGDKTGAIAAPDTSIAAPAKAADPALVEDKGKNAAGEELEENAEAPYADIDFLRKFSNPGRYKSFTPYFMALDNQGNVVVADSTNNCLQVFNPNDGSYLRTIGKKGSENGEFNNPQGVAFDNTTNNIIVADTGNNIVQVLRYSDGSHIRTIGRRGYGPINFNDPCSVAVDNNGNLYVYDTPNDRSRIQVFRVSSGNYVRTIIGNGVGARVPNGPGSIVLDRQGNVAVAGNNRVQIFNQDGTLLRTIGEFGQDDGKFDQPQGIAFDKAGNIIVADTNNHRVQVLNYNNGSHVRTIGSQGSGDGEFIWPYGVLIDDQGHIIVSDINRIQVFGKNNPEINAGVSTTIQHAEISKISSFEKETTTNTKASKIILSIGINDFTPLDMLLQYLDIYDITKINKACGADTFSKYDDKTQLLNINRYNPLTTSQTPQTEVYFDLFSDMIESNIPILIDIFKLGNPTIRAMIRNLHNSYTNLNKIGDDINVIHRATAILRAQLNSVVLRLQEGDIEPTKFGIDTTNPIFYEPKHSSDNNVFITGVIIYSSGSDDSKVQRIPFKIIQIRSNPNLYMVCISSNNRLPNELIEPVFTRGLNVNSYSVQIHGNTNIPKTNIKFIISQTDFENFIKTSVMSISNDLSGTELNPPVTFNNEDVSRESLLAWMVNEGVPKKINLLKCSKRDFFNLHFEKKDFFSSAEVFNNRQKEIDIVNKESEQCFMMYTKLFTSNKPVLTLLRLFEELVNLLYNYVDFIRIFIQPPYNKSDLVEEVTDLFNKLNLSNIEIKDFPYPFIDTFVDNLKPMILSIVKLFKIVFGVTYDKIRKIDLKNFKYLSLKYSHEYFSYSSFVTIADIHTVFLAQSYLRTFDVLEGINKNFQQIKIGEIQTLTDEQLIEIKNKINSKITELCSNEKNRANVIRAEYELRKRLPIVTYCGSIMKFLSDPISNTCLVFKNNVSQLILNISDITKNNTDVLKFFETLIQSFVQIVNSENCYKEIRKIYELLITICDIFVLNNPFKKNIIDGYKTIANDKVPIESQIKLGTKNLQHSGDRGIHILQEQVDKLDEIFKGCTPMTDKNNLSLIDHFTNFKNNLDCTIVSYEDIDNLQKLQSFIRSNVIVCLNNKQVKDSVNKILNTIQDNLKYLERQRANISIIDVLVDELDNISKKSEDGNLYKHFEKIKESMKNDGPITNIENLNIMHNYINGHNITNDYFKQCGIILKCLIYLKELTLLSTETLYASSLLRPVVPSSSEVPSKLAPTALAYGGKKQQKSATKKKQNNNKRVSIKKNKKCIITRNTRRRIFE